jgi:hypothetical protein
MWYDPKKTLKSKFYHLHHVFCPDLRQTFQMDTLEQVFLAQVENWNGSSNMNPTKTGGELRCTRKGKQFLLH